MGWRNSEGYPDPTPYEALKAIGKAARIYRPLVYICSPFSGDTGRNTERARGYCRFALSKGHMPLAPHLHYPQFMDDGDRQQRALGLRFALILLDKCDELWVFGSTVSSGMARKSKGRKSEVCQSGISMIGARRWRGARFNHG